MARKLRVSVVQAATSWSGVDKTLDEVERWTRLGQDEGSTLCVFPEAFIGGYPRGSTFGAVVGSRSPDGREQFLDYYNRAISLSPPDAAVARLCKISATASVFIVIGVIERSEAGGTLFCTALFVDPRHGVVGKHRKLMPTASERLIWGFGDGTTLPIVEASLRPPARSQEAVKAKVSATICWENYVAPLRHHYFSHGVQIYCAPTVDSRDTWESTMRHVALEGRCFVLSACQFARVSDFPEGHPLPLGVAKGKSGEDVMIAGGSMIVDPLGKVLAGPLRGEAGILTAEIDLDDCIRGHFDFDAAGHYSCVFEILVNGAKAGSDPKRYLVVPGEA